MRPAYSKLHFYAGPVVCSRRYCTNCGRWRLIVDFSPHSHAPDGTIVRWQTYCQTCRRVMSQQRKAREVYNGTHRLMLPVGPLVSEMVRFFELRHADHPRFTWDDFADLAGMSARQMLCYRNGERQKIGLALADRIAIAMDIPLMLIYPYDEQEAA